MTEITSTELKSRINQGEDIIILDVRQPEEHAEKNIPHSLLIPLNELPNRLDELEAYKGREIVVYCRSGARSGQAVQFLEASGYSKIKNLKGGILGW
jgi:adenylyltransferase/sulfurtransferase